MFKAGFNRKQQEVYEAMDEIRDMFGSVLINKFCTMLIHCQPMDPKHFYFNYQTDLCMHLM